MLSLSPSVSHIHRKFAYHNPLYALLSLGTIDALTPKVPAAGQDPAVQLHYCNGYELLPKPATFCSCASNIIFSRCSSPRLASHYSPLPSLTVLMFSSVTGIQFLDHTHSHLLHLFPFQISLALLSSSQNIAPPSHIAHRQPVFGRSYLRVFTT